MYLATATYAAKGPLPVIVLAGANHPPFASVDFAEGCDLRLDCAGDCDRLIIAATTAKRMLEASEHPHRYERPASGSHCARCGQREGRPVHDVASCPSASPDGDNCTVTTPGHAWHYGPDKGGGVRAMWQDKPVPPAEAAEAADPGYLEDAAAGEHDDGGYAALARGDDPFGPQAYLSHKPGCTCPDCSAARDGIAAAIPMDDGETCLCGQPLAAHVERSATGSYLCPVPSEPDGDVSLRGARTGGGS